MANRAEVEPRRGPLLRDKGSIGASKRAGSALEPPWMAAHARIRRQGPPMDCLWRQEALALPPHAAFDPLLYRANSPCAPPERGPWFSPSGRKAQSRPRRSSSNPPRCPLAAGIARADRGQALSQTAIVAPPHFGMQATIRCCGTGWNVVRTPAHSTRHVHRLLPIACCFPRRATGSPASRWIRPAMELEPGNAILDSRKRRRQDALQTALNQRIRAQPGPPTKHR
jgi:hypothetical protein